MCRTELPWSSFNAPNPSPCPVCGIETAVTVFPSYYNPPPRQAVSDSVLIDGEAACFHHPNRKAVVACESCGRFLCALCHVNFGGQNFCAACIETGRKKDRITSGTNRRVRYDDQAIALSVYPLVLFPVTIITAPAALAIAIRRWKSPMSIFGRSRSKLVLASILSTIEIAAWVTGAFYLYNKYGI